MDTKESKTPEEEKEHVMGQRIPEDYDEAEPQRQPEAKKPPTGMHRLLPVAVVLVLIAGLAFHFLGR
ncbi:hypothetical protein SAMN05192555_10332 [Franzmannia pantelleriensis]|uniref:Uncharacterized protein n=1 Tax=Franzmannia pantelleriensis TaxID=48727 RepID=A0A1G9I0E3_9GAMM|nr:hypothetical protein [Halomonas pantelleriensis]SDL18710.1 hypothetical protein SAMN05192555_10332 [Halomonas pantelleriensis]